MHHNNSKFTLPPFRKSIFLLSFLVSITFSVFGQSYKPIPNDPRVTVGGVGDLTYWVGNPTGEPEEQFLNLRSAWFLTTGDPTVKVAIICNGVDWNQPDMPGDNQLGKNFVDNNLNTSAQCLPYISYSGTEVSSVIFSKTYNSLGMFGVASGWMNTPGVTPVILKVTNWNPTDDNVWINGNNEIFPKLMQSIDSAMSIGVKVILLPHNFMDLTNDQQNQFNTKIASILADPCNEVTFIAAAGDHNPSNLQYDHQVRFPGTCDQIITVGGVFESHLVIPDTYLHYSCYGQHLDFVAGYSSPVNRGNPCSNPYVDPYSFKQSTASSSAQIAGVVALMYSVNPHLHQDEVFQILQQSCFKTTNYDDYVDGWSEWVGYGFPNAKTAIELAQNYRGGIEISDVQEWPSLSVPSNFITGNITIKSGGKLTLNWMTLGITTGKSIMIEPGGKLITNYSTITNACSGKPWKGIQVAGNKNANQYPNAQGVYQQGYLELNNSTVSNAEIAADLWKPNDYSTTGGIIKATNSNFENNGTAVHALRYKNTHPGGNGMETNYIAQFNNCTFKINNSYLAANKTFYKHIDLDHVKGPNFFGCDFILEPNVNNVSTWNQAIASYSSGFAVTSPCIAGPGNNCADYDYSNINGFRFGINASRDLPTENTYTINHAIFKNNVYGILNNAVKTQKVINSDFYLGNSYGQYDTDCNFGIYMNSSNNFTIENNKFYKMAGAPQANYTGIFTAYTNAMDDIYRNTFDGMSFGNLATKQDWIEGWENEGLEYLCNTNTNNWADFYVYSDHSGIQNQQGGYSVAAGNKFSSTATWHFYNTIAAGNHEIGYYYNKNAPLEEPVVSKVNYVTITGIDYCNTCPDHFGNIVNVGVLTSVEIDALTTTHDNAKAQLQTLDILYNQLTDGGSTPIKLTEIQSANETQMWSLRSTLLANSPYLSDTVLRQVASRTDIFPDAILFEILAANPEALRNRNLMIYLAEKTNPLPEYMIGILEQVAGQNSTYKTIMQQQMSQFAREATKAANKVIDSYLNDTILDVASLNTWLIKKGGIEADKQRVALMISNNDYTGAMALAENLPIIYSLQHEALDNYTAWFDLLSLQKTLHDSNRDWSQLTEAERVYLEAVANCNFPEAAAIAQGILNYNYDTNYDHCFVVSDPGTLKHKAINPEDMAKAYGMTIAVNPNPARDWAEFTYTLPVNENAGEIVISDMQGRKVYAIRVYDGKGQKILDTRTYPSGTYLYTFKSGKYSLSGKIMVSK